MIGYVTLGTNDMDRGVAFYDDVLAPIGVKRLPINDRIYLWSKARGQPMLGLATPFDGQPASAGNGTMVAVLVDSRDVVEAVHARALAAGGADEGAPGERGGGPFYGGYFRDPDGNKVVVYTLG